MAEKSKKDKVELKGMREMEHVPKHRLMLTTQEKWQLAYFLLLAASVVGLAIEILSAVLQVLYQQSGVIMLLMVILFLLRRKAFKVPKKSEGKDPNPERK